MYVKDQKKFEDVLLQLKLLTKEQLNLVKVESARTGKSTEKLIEDLKLVSKEDLVKVKAICLGVPYVDLRGRKISPKVLGYLNKESAQRYQAIPFGESAGQLNVAMVDPNNVQVIDFIEKKSGCKINPYMASVESIKSIIDQYQDLSAEMKEALKSVEIVPEVQAKSAAEMETLMQDAPVTRAVNTILEYAAKSRASDVHIEPRDKGIKIRYRIDGLLQETMTLPKHIHPALVSRIKILSNLKIDEHRVPQDGRFQIKIEGREIDIRVSISPLVYGEKVVLRLLDKTAGVITLESLGLKGKAFGIIEEGTHRPHGMILSTGPTGSGKTTTMYAVISRLNQVSVNIITLEDPVEYAVSGVNQIQVNPAVGLTFANGLRSILRQDPDIILVGEIRDKETAELAVQAALTGHVVLSTIHTNSAAGVLPRMLDMEIEPFLIASTVNTVIGQRLIRKICSHCRKPYKASETEKDTIRKTLANILPKKKDPKAKVIFEELKYKNLPYIDDKDFTLYKGEGCDECRRTGFLGREGIFEIFPVTPKMERLVVGHSTTSEVQDAAVAEGMITMKQDGYLKALEGTTTLEEILRVAQDY